MKTPRTIRAVALVAAVAGVLTSTVLSPAIADPGERPAAGAIPSTSNARPTLRVPINVVLVGFDKDKVGPDLLAQLAPDGDPIVRKPAYYGINQPVGIHYDYDYRLVQTSEKLTNQFFSHQRRTGRDEDLTTYQQAYNDQTYNRVDVTGPVLSNDANATQRWLDKNVAGHFGINVDRSYTVYLINWWGRSDFRFHNYRVAKAVDPDTGVDWANNTDPYPYIPTTHRDQAALNGWGGTNTRSWFYDLSSGPDYNSENWEVDHGDLDGDGYFDYRIPPVWEYADDGFLPADYLASDLGAIVRYVGVNLLFTTSPIYDPMVYQPAAHRSLHLHTTIFEGNPAIDGKALTNTSAAAATLNALEPWLTVKSSTKDVTPTPPAITSAIQGFVFGTPQPPGCWQDYGFPAAALVCTLQQQQSSYLPVVGKDTLLPSYTFTATQDELSQAQFQAIALDNFSNGAPAATYQFFWPDIVAVGVGNTETTSHEAGHELGASHPHDGYDPTCGCLYSALGGTSFAWMGDESGTLMSYMHLTTRQFSVFDKDNIARDVYAGYLANTEPSSQQTLTQRLLLARAKLAFNSWQFPRAAELARQAWEKGAATVGVKSASRSALAATTARRGRPDFRDEEPHRVDLGEAAERSGTAESSSQTPPRPFTGE